MSRVTAQALQLLEISRRHFVPAIHLLDLVQNRDFIILTFRKEVPIDQVPYYFSNEKEAEKSFKKLLIELSSSRQGIILLDLWNNEYDKKK